jgi:hypothetical protein
MHDDLPKLDDLSKDHPDQPRVDSVTDDEYMLQQMKKVKEDLQKLFCRPASD